MNTREMQLAIAIGYPIFAGLAYLILSEDSTDPWWQVALWALVAPAGVFLGLFLALMLMVFIGVAPIWLSRRLLWPARGRAARRAVEKLPADAQPDHRLRQSAERRLERLERMLSKDVVLDAGSTDRIIADVMAITGDAGPLRGACLRLLLRYGDQDAVQPVVVAGLERPNWLVTPRDAFKAMALLLKSMSPDKGPARASDLLADLPEDMRPHALKVFAWKGGHLGRNEVIDVLAAYPATLAQLMADHDELRRTTHPRAVELLEAASQRVTGRDAPSTATAAEENRDPE